MSTVAVSKLQINLVFHFPTVPSSVNTDLLC